MLFFPLIIPEVTTVNEEIREYIEQHRPGCVRPVCRLISLLKMS